MGKNFSLNLYVCGYIFNGPKNQIAFLNIKIICTEPKWFCRKVLFWLDLGLFQKIILQ